MTTGPYVKRQTGYASHVTRMSDSSHYDEVCLLCGYTDAGNALHHTCYVGGTFCGTHKIEQKPGWTMEKASGDVRNPYLPVHCTVCERDTKIGLMGPCYEILPTPETVPVDEKMIEETLEVTGEVEAFFDYGDAEITHTVIRADRDISAPKIGTLRQAIFIPDGAAGTYVRVADDEEVIETPYGQITGPAEAVRYCADLIADDVAVALEQSETKTFEQELRALISRHAIENGSNTPDFLLARQIIGYLDLWTAGVKARDEWFSKSEPGSSGAPAAAKALSVEEQERDRLQREKEIADEKGRLQAEAEAKTKTLHGEFGSLSIDDYVGGDWGKGFMGPDAATWN